MRLGEERSSVSHGVGRRMTLRTIATKTRGDTDNGEAVSPMADIGTEKHTNLMVPEPVHTRPDACALEREGVAATDYFFERQDFLTANSPSSQLGVSEKAVTSNFQ